MIPTAISNKPRKKTKELIKIRFGQRRTIVDKSYHKRKLIINHFSQTEESERETRVQGVKTYTN